MIALQFHLETTKESLDKLIFNCGDEIVDSPYIQQPSEMLKDNSRFAAINEVMKRLLNYWISYG